MPREMTAPTDLGKAMNDRRIQLRMTWDALAEAAKITPAFLRKIRSGEAGASDLTKANLEEALGWESGTINALESKTGQPASPPPRGEPGHEPSGSPAERSFLDALRAEAKARDKSIGDILVERGLATPEELTLSDQKTDDPIVRDILRSDLPEETKNVLLMQYVDRRRKNFLELGVREESEAAQKEPRGV